jgi:hypothetical protein
MVSMENLDPWGGEPTLTSCFYSMLGPTMYIIGSLLINLFSSVTSYNASTNLLYSQTFQT